MKQHALALGALLLCSWTAHATDFIGPEFNLGLSNAKTTWTGGGLYNLNTGSGPNGTVADSKHLGWQPKVGMTYGWPMGKYFVGWVGLDVSGSRTLSDATVSSGSGPYRLEISRRRDAYVAIGDRIGPHTLQYLRFGQSVWSFGSMTDTATGSALGGDLNRYGQLFGLGLRHKPDENSPLSYTLDYSTIRSQERVLTPPSGTLGYASKIKVQALTLSVGYAF